jgi:flagellar basal-body rod protein FlgB
MDFSTMNALSTALDYGSKRLEALSNNLSNVNTPGYKRKDVSFQAMVDAASGTDDGQSVDMATDDPRQLTLEDIGAKSDPAIITQSGGAMRPDGNNVDIDAETTRLAAAQISYSGAAQMIQGQFSSLKYVIKGD